MSSKQMTDAFGSPARIGNSFKIRELLNKLLFHWPLFIIFLFISFVVAIIYIKVARPSYIIEAKVLIKNPESKKSEGVALKELNLTETGKGVETEMGLLTSIPNIEQVVTDLQLWITYKREASRFLYRDIYTSSPIEFKLLKAGKFLNTESFDVLIESKTSFAIKQSDNKNKSFSFNDKLVSTYGTWKLDTTDFIKNYIGKTIRITLQNPKDVVKQYQDKIYAANYEKANPTIDLSIEDEVPERGRAVLNDLLRVYTAASVEDKRKANQNTLHFVEERLASLTGELNAVEKNYVGYKSSRGITDVAAESTKFLNDAQSSDNQLNNINIQLSVLDGIEQNINSNQGADNPPSTIGLNDPGLGALIAKLTDLLLQRTRLLATTSESNPLFIPIKVQIDAARTAIKENIKSIRSALLATRSQIRSVGANYESSIRNIPVQERDLKSIARMQGIKENLYIYLLQKKEEISLDYASTISDARIVEQAHYGSQKSPLPGQAYAIAFLFGMLLPAGLVYGRDAIKNRVISKNEIAYATGLDVLGELIYEDNPEPIRVLNNKDYIGEQFRDLRTKVSYLLGKSDKGKITLLTSSISGEGKSFVSSNLSVTLAASGKKTIILEMDLRRPKLGQIFNLDKNDLGITDFLHGDATLDQIVKKTTYSDNLFIIGCGQIPPNPSELLESNNLALLLDDLRAKYDHILLDSPPVHIVTDATIIAPLCDVTLYMLRQDYTPKPELEFIEDLHRSKKFNRLNLVFNGVQNDKHGYGYKYTNNGYYTKSPEMMKSKVKKFFSRF